MPSNPTNRLRSAEIISALETRRLRLRPVDYGDAQATVELMTGRVARYLVSWLPDMTLRDCRARIRAARGALSRREDLNYAILSKRQGSLMGWIGMARDPAADGCARLGYWIGSAYEGQGLVSEAVEAFVPAAAAILGIRIVEASVHPDNPASGAILRAQGFAVCGHAWITFPASGREEQVTVYRKELGSAGA